MPRTTTRMNRSTSTIMAIAAAMVSLVAVPHAFAGTPTCDLKDIALDAQEISAQHGHLTGPLAADDHFGRSVASIGDLDGDGLSEVAVGAPKWEPDVPGPGAVWILFLNPDGTVRAEQKITQGTGGFTGVVQDGYRFGLGVAGLGDFDRDGIPDLAVGADRDPGGGSGRGAVWLLFLNSNGTVKAHQKISAEQGILAGVVQNNEGIGKSVAALGDIDGNGVIDLAAGSFNAGTNAVGAVWILRLNADGTVLGYNKIGGPTPNSGFGHSMAPLGDLDRDGVPDLAVSAPYKDGRLRIIFLNPNGSVKAVHLIDSDDPPFEGPDPDQGPGTFAYGLAAFGDRNGDGLFELAISARSHGYLPFIDTGPDIWIASLNPDGSVHDAQVYNADSGFGAFLGDDEHFASSMALIGDINGDGGSDLVVGVEYDDDGFDDAGAVWVITLDGCQPTILDQPDSLLVDVGDPAQFTVVVQSGEAPTFQWLKNGLPLTDGGSISGSITATLTIDPVAFADEGLYTVIVANPFGQVQSAAAELDVQLPFCLGDLNGNGVVNGLDLALLLGWWSTPPGTPGCGGIPGAPCPADLNDDGLVNGIDLAILLGQWGPCPN